MNISELIKAEQLLIANTEKEIILECIQCITKGDSPTFFDKPPFPYTLYIVNYLHNKGYKNINIDIEDDFVIIKIKK
jgi:hypothetical protein